MLIETNYIRDQLYNGKWYVDCSTGGAQYGQGMYCAADYTGTLSDGIKWEMVHYRQVNEGRGNGLNYTETLTLDKSAKIVKYEELESMMQEVNYNRSKEIIYSKIKGTKYEEDENAKIVIDAFVLGRDIDFQKKMQALSSLLPDEQQEILSLLKTYGEEISNSQIKDKGSFAALYGYDAINAEGHGGSGSYTVILNRTKLIIKRN